MPELLYKEEVYAIVGAAMMVYNELGFGFLEAVYQEALEIELTARGIPHAPQQCIPVTYRGIPLQKFYVADFVAYDKIIIELKAMNTLTNVEEAQVINYLRATGYALGLLINFGCHDKLQYKRLINTPKIGVQRFKDAFNREAP
ncbi:MAG TPA: GxxExxY protein [Anaerolineae bacterium]|jgi:GxxExxY protein